jgi:hypothetical protein
MLGHNFSLIITFATAMSLYSTQAYHFTKEPEKAQPLLGGETLGQHSRPIIFDVTCGLLGALIGFVVRIISLKASSLVSSSDHVTSFFILSQADLALHVIIWISFLALVLVDKSEDRRKVLTSSVISLLIGVLVGSFIAWNCIDLTLGFPLSWKSRILSTNMMVVQCWLLYRCHQIVLHKSTEAESNSEDTEAVPFILAIV